MHLQKKLLKRKKRWRIPTERIRDGKLKKKKKKNRVFSILLLPFLPSSRFVRDYWTCKSRHIQPQEDNSCSGEHLFSNIYKAVTYCNIGFSSAHCESASLFFGGLLKQVEQEEGKRWVNDVRALRKEGRLFQHRTSRVVFEKFHKIKEWDALTL